MNVIQPTEKKIIQSLDANMLSRDIKAYEEKGWYPIAESYQAAIAVTPDNTVYEVHAIVLEKINRLIVEE